MSESETIASQHIVTDEEYRVMVKPNTRRRITLNTTITEQETTVTISLTYTNAGRVLDAVWRQCNGDTASVNPDSRRNWEEIYHSIAEQMDGALTPTPDDGGAGIDPVVQRKAREVLEKMFADSDIYPELTFHPGMILQYLEWAGIRLHFSAAIAASGGRHDDE